MLTRYSAPILAVFAACASSLAVSPRLSPAPGALPYQDPRRPVAERVDDLLARMTIDEKVGQMTQADHTYLKSPDDVARYFLGSVLSGDGGTTNGIDRGDTRVDEATLRRLHLPGYVAAVKAGVGTVMASFNSWNGQKIHGHKYLLTTLLKGELGFKGFVVSDGRGPVSPCWFLGKTNGLATYGSGFVACIACRRAAGGRHSRSGGLSRDHRAELQ